jgi:hypothetical protein
MHPVPCILSLVPVQLELLMLSIAMGRSDVDRS